MAVWTKAGTRGLVQRLRAAETKTPIVPRKSAAASTRTLTDEQVLQLSRTVPVADRVGVSRLDGAGCAPYPVTQFGDGVNTTLLFALVIQRWGWVVLEHDNGKWYLPVAEAKADMGMEACVRSYMHDKYNLRVRPRSLVSVENYPTLRSAWFRVALELELEGDSTGASAAAAAESKTPAVCCTRCTGLVTARLRCSRCKAVYYCSRDCQRVHWKEHKASCGSKADGAAADRRVPDPRLPALPQGCRWFDTQAVTKQRMDLSGTDFIHILEAMEPTASEDSAQQQQQTKLGPLSLTPLSVPALPGFGFPCHCVETLVLQRLQGDVQLLLERISDVPSGPDGENVGFAASRLLRARHGITVDVEGAIHVSYTGQTCQGLDGVRVTVLCLVNTGEAPPVPDQTAMWIDAQRLGTVAARKDISNLASRVLSNERDAPVLCAPLVQVNLAVNQQ